MRRRAVYLIVAAAFLAARPVPAQEGHPLSGTWVGDWGPSPTDRTRVTVVMTWDGKQVGGLINPGPDAVPVGRVDVDWGTWTVRLQAAAPSAGGGPARIAAEARLDGIGSSRRTLRGTWTQGARSGDLTLTREGAEAGVGANRPRAAVYDATRRVTLDGRVSRVEWVTPSAFVFVDVTDATGVVRRWGVEVGNPLELERGGWSSTTVRPGDTVRVDGAPALGMVNRVLAREVTAAGRRVFTPPAPRTAPAGDAPRWPDGRVRLGPPPGDKGYWSTVPAGAVREQGSGNVEISTEGLLANLADADRVAPFLPWAKAVYLYRQRTRLQDDPTGRCLPPGGPRQFQAPNGFQFVEQPALDRILLLLGGGNRNYRVIHTDGRPVGQPADAVPSYFGHNVGRWEGDTLVVESVGYNERFWLGEGGLPHTEALRLVERFTRRGLGTLEYEVTIDDPRTYSRPWTTAWTMQWAAGEEIAEFFCEEGAEVLQ